MSLVPFTVLWVAMVLSFVGLALYRGTIAKNEKAVVYAGSAAGDVATRHQQELARKLTAIESKLRLLGMTTLLYGLILGGLFIYNAWTMSASGTGLG